jgi:hypothetical protein
MLIKMSNEWRGRTCGECVFWRSGGGDEGACHEKPPVPMGFTEVVNTPNFVDGKVVMQPAQKFTLKAVYPPMSRANLACGKFDEAELITKNKMPV